MLELLVYGTLMAYSSYFEQLKHPKWQKKRLEILQLNEFTCEECGADDQTLHIHHSYYEKGRAPWDYPESSLHCLCAACHQRIQNSQSLLQRQIGRLDLSDTEVMIGYAMGLEFRAYPVVRLRVFSYAVAQGIGDAWGVTPEQIIEALEAGRIDGYTLDSLVRLQIQPQYGLVGEVPNAEGKEC